MEFEVSELSTNNYIELDTKNVLNDDFFEVPNLSDNLFIDYQSTSQQNHDNIQDLKLFDDALVELSEFIQLNPVKESITVAMPKKAVNDLYHLTRNGLTPISVYYNISNNARYLKIELISGSMATEETIKFCKLSQKKNAKHSNYWFLCNDNTVNLGDFLQIDLNPERNERCLSIKFACNSSCESMFKRIVLKFSIIDHENREICQQSFKIRVSERPARDERELIIRENKEEYKSVN